MSNVNGASIPRIDVAEEEIGQLKEHVDQLRLTVERLVQSGELSVKAFDELKEAVKLLTVELADHKTDTARAVAMLQESIKAVGKELKIRGGIFAAIGSLVPIVGGLLLWGIKLLLTKK